MKRTKYFIKAGIGIMLILLVFSNSCTKLTTLPYTAVTSSQALSTQSAVISDFLRPFGHGFWTVQGAPFQAQEITSDELMTANRLGNWANGGYGARMYYHTWTILDISDNLWSAFYQGASLATNSLQDMESLNNPTTLANLGLTQAQLADFEAELRTMRAWFHLRALDAFRNIVLVKEVKDSTTAGPQVTPQVASDFIESELKAAIPNLPTRQSLGPNWMGRWTQAGAAALLARLYLNSQVYTGVNRFSDCDTICQSIINGRYGSYSLDSAWYAPFDYTNAINSEVIFGFNGNGVNAGSNHHWHYTNDMYWWMMSYQVPSYFGFSDWGSSNNEYSMTPGRSVDSVEYPFALGKPFVKFQKYPDDYRLQLYKNLGNSQRQGMFLFGYLPYINSNGQQDTVRDDQPTNTPLFFRDQVGMFLATPPGTRIADTVSNINHADFSSGILPVKYPWYPTSDPNRITSAYAEIRYSEIYYMLAECEYRAGNKAGAAVLLNAVRKRDYPPGSPSLYTPDGSQLTDQEMLDEWGREFLVERRRRTDLIRWGVFNSGTWWDKQPDPDNHTAIFPLGQTTLQLSPQLKQNPGY
jgi:starch-binding outer membrane protein, SusD/RagB family